MKESSIYKILYAKHTSYEPSFKSLLVREPIDLRIEHLLSMLSSTVQNSLPSSKLFEQWE